MKLVAYDVYTYIYGSHPKRLLDSVTSYPDSNRWFVKAYKSGYWDGRQRYIHFDKESGVYRFATGFLQRVTTVLDEGEVPYELIDNRRLESFEPIYELNDFKKGKIYLNEGKYSYQAPALDMALSHCRGIVKMATGSGKSEIGAAIINSIKRQTAWLTHRRSLLYQTQARLNERLNTRIGIVGDGHFDLQQITVLMIQSIWTLAKKESEELFEWLDKVDLLIGDEVHHLESGQWYDIFAYIQAPFRIGLSATPNLDGPGLSLLAQTGSIIVDIPAVELIKRKVLVPPRIWVIKVPEPKIPVSIKDKETGKRKKVAFQTVYKEGITENIFRNSKIIEVCRQFKREKKSTLVLVSRIKHGELLADMMYECGIKVQFLSGKDSAEIRDTGLNKLWNGEIDIVIGQVQCFAEGIDIPPLRAVVNATGSSGGGNGEEGELGRVTVQILGRGLRCYPGKEYLDYVDFADYTHSFLTNASIDRLSTLQSQGYMEMIKYWEEYVPDTEF